MAEKLNIDDDQLNCIKGVNESYKNQLSDIGSKLRTQTYVFRNRMNDSNSTKEEKLASFDDVATTKGQLRRTRMEMALEIRDILTTDQIITLNEMISNNPRKRGCG